MLSSPANNKSETRGAHTAHASDRIEDEGLFVGSLRIHRVPMRKIGFGLQLDSGDDVLGCEGTVSV